MRIFKKGAEKEITVDPLALFRQDKLKWAQGSCYSTKRRPDFKSSFSNLFTLSSKSYLCKMAAGNWLNQKSLPGWHSSFPHHKQEGPRKEKGCLPVPPAPPPRVPAQEGQASGPFMSWVKFWCISPWRQQDGLQQGSSHRRKFLPCQHGRKQTEPQPNSIFGL